MEIAGIIWKLFLGIGIVAAVAIPFVPFAVRSLISLPTVKTMGDGMGLGFAILFWWALMALVAIVSSIVALIAAISAHEQPGTVILCGVPMMLAVAASFATWLFLIR
jgi:hypothetical protein